MKTVYDTSTLVRDYELPPRVRWCVVQPDTGFVGPIMFLTRKDALELCAPPNVVRKVLIFVKFQGRSRSPKP